MSLPRYGMCCGLVNPGELFSCLPACLKGLLTMALCHAKELGRPIIATLICIDKCLLSYWPDTVMGHDDSKS